MAKRGKGMVIGFTATVFKTHEGFEANNLVFKSFEVFDSKTQKP